MTEPNNNVNIITDLAYIKLSKNSRGFTWDIKAIVGTKEAEIQELILMIKRLNDNMDNMFNTSLIMGSKSNGEIE